MPLIEITKVSVTAKRIIGEPSKMTINTEQIVSMNPGPHDTTAIELIGDKRVHAQENYAEVKKRCGMK